MNLTYIMWSEKRVRSYILYDSVYVTLWKEKLWQEKKKLVVTKGQECRDVTDYKVSWENTLGWWDYILTVVLLYEYTHLLKFLSFYACIFTVFKLYPNTF